MNFAPRFLLAFYCILGTPIEVQEIKIQREKTSDSTVWIVVGVCCGVFVVILAILIFIYCRKKQESEKKMNISKSEISYPNSIGKSG